MRTPYLILILLLAAAAIGSTWLLRQPVPAAATTVLADLHSPPDRPVPAVPAMAALPEEPVAREQVQQLVEFDLFRPDRMDPSKRPPPPPPKPPEITVVIPEEVFELVGVARIGDEACASIAVQSHTVTRSAQSKTPGQSGLPTERKLYRLGERVGETGYVLQDVGIDYAILGKGTKSLELRIDPDSKSSVERRKPSATAAATQAPGEIRAVETGTPVGADVEEPVEAAP